MTAKLTQSQVAALVGVTARRIRQISQEDQTFPDCDNGYECAEVGEWLRKRALEECGITDDNDGLDLTKERARLTKAQREIAELNKQELDGQLVRVTQVSRFWANSVIAFKSKVRGSATKLAPMLAPAMTPLEVQKILEETHDEALAELSRDFSGAE